MRASANKEAYRAGSLPMHLVYDPFLASIMRLQRHALSSHNTGYCPSSLLSSNLPWLQIHNIPSFYTFFIFILFQYICASLSRRNHFEFSLNEPAGGYGLSGCRAQSIQSLELCTLQPQVVAVVMWTTLTCQSSRGQRVPCQLRDVKVNQSRYRPGVAQRIPGS